jgi:hypothetical protein
MRVTGTFRVNCPSLVRNLGYSYHQEKSSETLAGPFPRRRKGRGPKLATILAEGGCFVQKFGRNGGIKTEIPVNNQKTKVLLIFVV